MKKFLTNYFGVLGLILYYPIAILLRIPIFFILAIVIILLLLIWVPFTGKEDCLERINKLYNWYRGK